MKKIIWAFAGFLYALSAQAQVVPTPAEPQSEAILIMNATAHLGNGTVIPQALIGFEKGKLTLVADAKTTRVDMAKYKKVIDAAGKHVYPGLIATNTPLGLVEIESVRATVDVTETGDFNPSIRSIVAYSTDSHVTPTVRSNGVLLAQIVPEGGIVSGTSSVVELDGWNWEDAAYKTDEGMWLNFPSIFSFGFNFGTGVFRRKNEEYAKQIAAIDGFFAEAQAYTKKTNIATKNLKFEAMRGVFNRSKTLFVRAQLVKEITDAVLLAKKYGLKTVVVGGRDAWMLTDFLKENEVAVMLQETQDLPSRDDEDIDQPFKTPALLQKAGVLYCNTVDGGWQQRNLPLMAGQAVAFGLGYEEAISSISLNAAKILGIDKTVGSLEVGKDATLVVSEGDILDMRSSIVTHAFIRGKAIDLNNKHKDLYRRFKTKYDRQGR